VLAISAVPITSLNAVPCRRGRQLPGAWNNRSWCILLSFMDITQATAGGQWPGLSDGFTRSISQMVVSRLATALTKR
jgi:hypothetical protein